MAVLIKSSNFRNGFFEVIDRYRSVFGSKNVSGYCEERTAKEADFNEPEHGELIYLCEVTLFNGRAETFRQESNEKANHYVDGQLVAQELLKKIHKGKPSEFIDKYLRDVKYE